ncbi:MAG TPA: hypothetical protein V6C95_17975 [Coleofasciculaceae cyanobacterium]
MKVVEHNESRLVIKDGSPWYNLFPLYNLFSGKWNGVIQVVSGLGVVALYLGWKTGKFPDKFPLVTNFVFLLLASSYILAWATKPYRNTPIYVFDKSIGELTVHHDESSKSYALSDIVDVVAVSRRSDDSPRTYWQKIHLVMQSGEKLELHPGHAEPNKQEEMVTLIRQFLALR